MPADAFQQLALSALLALLARRDARLVGCHFPFGQLEILRKPPIKFLNGFSPREFALFDLVKFLFHTRRESDVEDVLETLNQ